MLDDDPRITSPSMFDAWPDELLLRVLDELVDDPELILRGVSAVSRRWRRVATDDGLWFRICERILTRFTTNSTGGSGTETAFKRDIWLRATPDAPGSMVDFWRRFVRLWAPRLGWWADMDGAHGALFRIAADLGRGALQCDRLLLANDMESARPTDTLDPDKPGGVPPGVVLERGVLSVLTDAAARAYLDIHLLRPRVVPRDVFVAQYDRNAPTGMVMWAGTSAEHRSVHPSAIYSELQLPRTEAATGGDCRPFPTPALLPAIRCLPAQSPFEQKQIRCLNSLYGRRLAPLRAPRDLTDDLNDPVQAGWYAGTYGAHGCELVFVHTVTVDASHKHSLIEFPGDADALPASAPTRGRRLEGIKITGDPNVPKGQRSFVGFLSSPQARGFGAVSAHSPTSPSSSITQPTAHAIPEHSPRPAFAPWPLDARGAHVLSDVYASGDAMGATAPGLGRIAARGFREPRWTECVVHVAGRGEIELLWLEMGIVTTFRRLNL